MIIPVIFFSFTYLAFANEQDNSLDVNDSIYRHNALENKVNFSNTINNDEKSEKKTVENIITIKDESIEKLKEITENQASSTKKSENAMTAMKKENGIKIFFLGNNSGILKFQMVQMKGQSYDLKTLLSKTEDSEVRDRINIQTALLDKEKTRVENFILEQDSRFSLFGWLVSSL